MEQPTRHAWLAPAIGGFLVAVVAIGGWQAVANYGLRIPNPLGGQACHIGVYSTQLTVTVQPDLGYEVDCKKAVQRMDASAPPSSATLACKFKVKHGEVSIHDGGGGGLLAGLLGPMLCSKLRENPDVQLVTS